MAEGQITDPPQTAERCADWKDNQTSHEGQQARRGRGGAQTTLRGAPQPASSQAETAARIGRQARGYPSIKMPTASLAGGVGHGMSTGKDPRSHTYPSRPCMGMRASAAERASSMGWLACATAFGDRAERCPT